MPRDYKKINNIVCIDFETGGLSAKKNPVTEFAGVLIDTVSLEIGVRYSNLVKPYDQSLAYEDIAMKLTGLSKDRCEKEGIPLRQLVDDICQLFEEAMTGRSKNFKPILVAHNSPFDTPFLLDIFERAGKDLSKYVHGYIDIWGHFQPYFDDTIIEVKKVRGHLCNHDTKFNLPSCCQEAGIQLFDGHRALQDTVSLAELMIHNIRKSRSGSGETTVVNGNTTTVTHRQKFEW